MITYNLTVTEKQNFLIQLRILRPDLSMKTLEVLYYVWKFPDSFQKELVKDKLYKNYHVVNTSLTNMTDMELLESVKEGRNMRRILSPGISKHIHIGSVEIRLTLNQVE